MYFSIWCWALYYKLNRFNWVWNFCRHSKTICYMIYTTFLMKVQYEWMGLNLKWPVSYCHCASFSPISFLFVKYIIRFSYTARTLVNIQSCAHQLFKRMTPPRFRIEILTVHCVFSITELYRSLFDGVLDRVVSSCILWFSYRWLTRIWLIDLLLNEKFPLFRIKLGKALFRDMSS